jgi:hypothetical protein
VVEANAKYQERRKRVKKHLELMRLSLAAMQITNATFDALDAWGATDDDIDDDNKETIGAKDIE